MAAPEGKRSERCDRCEEHGSAHRQPWRQRLEVVRRRNERSRPSFGGGVALPLRNDFKTQQRESQKRQILLTASQLLQSIHISAN